MEEAPRKKRRKGKLFLLSSATLAALFLLLFRCGGFGLGLGGWSIGESEEQADDSSPARKARDREAKGEDSAPCVLRLDAGGLHHDGQSITLAEAVEICRKVGRAALQVTGDAAFGELERVREAFKRANIELFSRYPDE